jgi:peroxiredoxin
MPFTLSLGSSAPDFNLPGVDGKNYSLANFKNAKALVVVFWCNHCPYVIGSEDRINKFYADYAPKGVQIVAINSNETDNHPLDSFELIATLCPPLGA